MLNLTISELKSVAKERNMAIKMSLKQLENLPTKPQ